VVRALVADAPLADSHPALPGPAAVVERVPVESELVQFLEGAGFSGLTWTRLSSTHCFHLEGVGLREVMLLACKPEERILAGKHVVVYRGPFRQVVDDHGQVYHRGERVTVAARSAKLLQHGPYAEHFVFLTAHGSARSRSLGAEARRGCSSPRSQGHRAAADPLQSENCARLLRALADPERLRLMQCLRDGPRNVSELTQMLEGQIANVSHHLGVLRQAGLVLDDKKGRFVLYRLHPEVYRATTAVRADDTFDLGCCRLEIPQ
jgi:DNA-binding transcriptional ArsR family regulator